MAPTPKLNRGTEHLQALHNKVKAWSELNPHKIVKDDDGKGLNYMLRVHFAPPPDLVRWAILAGDALFNYRCALDHAIYELATRETGQDPPPFEDDIGFPICTDPQRFSSKVGLLKLREVLRAETIDNVIQGLQPYEGRDQALFRLHTLNNRDKHRTLQLGVSRSVRTGTGIALAPGARPIRVTYAIGDIKEDTILAQITYAEPQRQVHVDYDFAFEIFFQDELSRKSNMVKTITQIREEVVRVIEVLGL